MTVVGSGGAVIEKITFLRTFERDYKKLDAQMKERVGAKLSDLRKDPRPPGLAFEKLKGYSKPDLYTIHVTGNYKISLEIVGNEAKLRRVGTHNAIDRSP